MINNIISDITDYLKSTFSELEVIDFSTVLNLHQIPKLINDIIPSSKVVVISVVDHFVYSSLVKTFNNETPDDIPYLVSNTVSAIHRLSRKFTETNFIVLQENLFVDRELSQLPELTNLFFISSISEMFAEHEVYRMIQPVVNKVESSKYILALNNNPRPHRVGLIMYLMYKQLQDISTISFMSAERARSNISYDCETFLDWAHWNENKIRNSFKQLQDSNFNQYKFLEEEVYSEEYSNTFNFTNKLKKHYEHSFIEVITETTCIEPSLCLTEKYINSVFGCVFPILISTQGTVQMLRDLGFDVFDDIIDHSYDSEANHFYRMKKAIDLNYDFLSSNKVNAVWNNSKDRFLANVAHYKNNLYDQEYKRIIQDILNIKDCVIT